MSQKTEFFFSPVGRGSPVDVRTNMLVLLVINTLLLTGKGGLFQSAATAIITALFLLHRRWYVACVLVLCTAGLTIITWGITRMPVTSLTAGLLMAFLYTRPYLLAGFMGYYFVSVTTPAMLIAGLNRLHIPRPVSIPLAVMLRFFPVLREEARAIRGAMRLRGLPGKGGMLLHPWRTLEFILIPLISNTLRSGEALSASALSRGLGSPVTPTTILRLKLTPFADGLLVLLCLALVALFFFQGVE